MSKKKLGMTLVEVLVTIVIGTISAAAIFYSYNIFNKSYQSVEDKAVMNTSARNALSVILKDLRNAGYCDLNFKDSKDCDLIIQKKDNHYAGVKNYTVNFYQYYSGKGPDYLAIWYNTPATDRYNLKRTEIRYFLTRYENNVNEMYLAREVIENPTTNPKRVYCESYSAQKNCSPESIVPYASDFQVVFIDKDGNEVRNVCFRDPCAPSQTEKDNQLKVHTVEIYLTVRSPNKIYRETKEVIFINHDPASGGGEQKKNDRYHRETFYASVYLRNIAKN